MRYLVTGGFGFMGSWVATHLAEQGHEVFILSRSARGRSFISAQMPFSFIQADLSSVTPRNLATLLPDGLDGCVHTASCNDSFVDEYGAKAILANILGTRTLLEALLTKYTSKALPVFVYASTVHVYGRESGVISEETMPAPRSEYALTHFVAEEYCRYYGRVHGLPAIVLRCTNGYGSPLCSPFGKWYLLFSDMCRMAFTQGEIVLRSSPSIQRDFIWMGDVAAFVHCLLPRRDMAGQYFNVGQGQGISLGTLATIVADSAAKILGKPVSVHFQTAHDIPVSLLQVDTHKVIQASGHEPAAFFEQEVALSLAFLKQYGEI